jgi:hypothetical protein
MTQEEFSKTISKLSAFYNHKLNDTQVQVWFDMFSGFTIADFNNALGLHIRTSTDNRFPALGAIYQIIVENRSNNVFNRPSTKIDYEKLYR